MAALVNLKLKRKLFIAMALTTIIPFLAVTCYFSGIEISFLAVIAILFLTSFGWVIIFNVFLGIIKVNDKYSSMIQKEKEHPAVDEVQNIEGIINVMSDKVKTGLTYLKEYSNRTKELNREISKKVLTLSTILKANEMFSETNDSEKVVKILVEGLKNVLNVHGCFLCLENEDSHEMVVVKKVGIEDSDLDQKVEEDRLFFARLVRTCLFDESMKTIKNWKKELNATDIIFTPITSGEKRIGFLCVFDNRDYAGYICDEIETVSLFAQNIAVMWDHKILELKIDSLEITDSLTGLYNSKYMIQKLEEETLRAQACQRPCGFILVKLEKYKEYQQLHGDLETERVLKKTARLFKRILSITDISGRMETDKLATILIEKTKRETVKLKTMIENTLKSNVKEIEISVSMAEVPIDGINAQQILNIVQERLNQSEQ
ncbi:MAG: diguanylate cyclase [Candidatus Omnitrophica bacterium]|jgi:diguanylate cyclase (GGDEF)-like protein|nr:diguanylate cyclase [Candidatus Omnitrophota bacterium]MDD5080855.1 diguanylate cyclase [Candidatus Omnitrophota bacterium]